MNIFADMTPLLDLTPQHAATDGRRCLKAFREGKALEDLRVEVEPGVGGHSRTLVATPTHQNSDAQPAEGEPMFQRQLVIHEDLGPDGGVCVRDTRSVVLEGPMVTRRFVQTVHLKRDGTIDSAYPDDAQPDVIVPAQHLVRRALGFLHKWEGSVLVAAASLLGSQLSVQPVHALVATGTMLPEHVPVVRFGSMVAIPIAILLGLALIETRGDARTNRAHLLLAQKVQAEAPNQEP